MEVKFSEEQEELLIKNYVKACTRIVKLCHFDKAVVKVFLLECIGEMLSEEVNYRLHDEMISDTLKATMEFMLK